MFFLFICSPPFSAAPSFHREGFFHSSPPLACSKSSWVLSFKGTSLFSSRTFHSHASSSSIGSRPSIPFPSPIVNSAEETSDHENHDKLNKLASVTVQPASSNQHSSYTQSGSKVALGMFVTLAAMVSDLSKEALKTATSSRSGQQSSLKLTPATFNTASTSKDGDLALQFPGTTTRSQEDQKLIDSLQKQISDNQLVVAQLYAQVQQQQQQQQQLNQGDNRQAQQTPPFQDQITEKEALIHTLECSVDELTTDLRSTHSALQGKIFELNFAENALSEKRQALTQAEKDRDEALLDMEKLKDEYSALKSKIDASSSQALATLTAKTEALRQENAALLLNLDTLHQRLDAKSNELQQAQSTIDDLKKMHQQHVQQLTLKIQTLDQENSTIKANIQSLQTDLQAKMNQLKLFQAEIFDLKNKMQNDDTETHTKYIADIEALKQNNLALTSKVDTLLGNLEMKTVELEQAQIQVMELKKDYDLLENEKKKVEDSQNSTLFDKTRQQLDYKEAQLAEANKNLTAAQDKVKALSESLIKVESEKNQTLEKFQELENRSKKLQELTKKNFDSLSEEAQKKDTEFKKVVAKSEELSDELAVVRGQRQDAIRQREEALRSSLEKLDKIRNMEDTIVQLNKYIDDLKSQIKNQVSNDTVSQIQQSKVELMLNEEEEEEDEEQEEQDYVEIKEQDLTSKRSLDRLKQMLEAEEEYLYSYAGSANPKLSTNENLESKLDDEIDFDLDDLDKLDEIEAVEAEAKKNKGFGANNSSQNKFKKK